MRNLLSLLAVLPFVACQDDGECLVGDVIYSNGDSIGYIGLECLNGTHFDGLVASCENGSVVDEDTVLSCAANCVQCRERGWGAALCLSSPEVPSYCSPPTSSPTSPPVATSPPVTVPTEVDCTALGWAGSCGAYADIESCNCWTSSSFACSWSGDSCGTGGGGGGPTPTPPPVTPPTVDCAALGWAGSCEAFTDADSCNCWTPSSFACSWSGDSCSTGGGGSSPTTAPPAVTPVDCTQLGWGGACDGYTSEVECECWASSSFACSWSGGSCGSGGGNLRG